MGFSELNSTYCGYLIGKKDWKGFDDCWKSVFKNGFVFIFVVGVLITIFSKQISLLFTSHEEALEISIYNFRISLFSSLADFMAIFFEY